MGFAERITRWGRRWVTSSGFCKAAVLSVLVVMSAFTSASAQSGGAGYEIVPGQILVQPRAGLSDAQLNRILDRQGARSIGRIPQIGVRIARVPERAEEQVSRALARNPQMRFAEPNRYVSPVDSLVPDDPRFDDGWHLERIKAPSAWSASRGEGVVIAILDTGVDASHADMDGKLLPGYNVADGSRDTSDVHGHGTRVAGAAAAATDNSIGVAAVGWDAQILPVRITNRSDGYATYSDIAQGLTWAADQNAHVANISYDATNSATVASAAEYMRNRGGSVVVAAGNAGTDPGYAGSPYMLSISATTSNDSKASWSNYGDWIDLAAPGVGILTTNEGGGYASVSGTSFASPVTAGVVALVRSANTDLSPETLEDILKTTAHQVTGDEHHPYYGYGRVDASAAVAKASSSRETDTQPPDVAITAPAPDSIVDGLVDVDVSADDNVGVERVDLYANGYQVGSTEISPYEFTWDSTRVNDGTATLTAYAFDTSGNRGEAEIQVEVANSDEEDDTGSGELPSVSFSSPSDGETVSGNHRVEASAYGDNGITMMRVYVDGSLLCASDSSSIRCGWQTRHHGSSSATLTAEADDGRGNTGTASVSVSVEQSSGGGGGGGNNGGGRGNNR